MDNHSNDPVDKITIDPSLGSNKPNCMLIYSDVVIPTEINLIKYKLIWGC